MAWAVHPADTVGTPTDPGLWTEAENIGATRVADLLEIAEGQIRAYAPALAVGATVPASYRIATVLQARDNWQASRRVGDSVAVGDTAYAIRVRPISDAIKSMVRPPEGVAGFASGVSTFTPAPAPTVDLSGYVTTEDLNAALAAGAWVYTRLTTDLTTSSRTVPVSVGLDIPAGLADGLYEMDAMVQGVTSDGAYALQFAVAWGPTAPLRAHILSGSNSALTTASPSVSGNYVTPLTGFPSPFLPLRVYGMFRASAMVDPISLTVRSELDGVPVTVLADSFVRYRKVAA